MIKQKIKHLLFLGLLVLVSSCVYGQWIVDNDFGFKINVPSSWTQNSSMDGTDKVYDFMSPDENAAIQLRAFEATAKFTVDLLVQVYEESMLPQGSTKESLTHHISKQGIPGKQGIYSFNYNGTPVTMGVFFAIKNGKGYVISAIIPSSMLQRKSAEVKQVTESFTLLGNKPQTGGSKLSGLTGGTMVSSFKITNIQLTDKLDRNNNAINPHSTFNTRTPEIHAVISFTGHTSKDLTVDWIYTNWNRTITSDKYNFTDNNGVGVVSLSKPNNGWPVGNYKIVFEMGGKVIDSKIFEVKEVTGRSSGLSGLPEGTSGSGKVSGRYNLISRSDGQEGYNYLYYIFNDNGTMIEKHQPKGSGGYIGEHKGYWTVNGTMLEIKFDWGTYNYEIIGNTLKQTDNQGVVFTYRKQ